jgi:spermine oxidase
MWSIFLLSVTILSGINCKAINSDKDDPRIVIVGAGLAGVTALAELLDNGYRNVVLLEAQNRIGGRIETVPFGANVADLGAQWVHGEKDNVIFEMVSKYGLLDKSPYAWLGIGGKLLILRKGPID